MLILSEQARPARRPLGALQRRSRPSPSAVGPFGILAALALVGSLLSAADRVEPPNQSGPGPALPSPAVVREKAPAMVLVWFDPQGLLPSSVPPLMREVTAIFRGIGVEVGWRSAGPGMECGEGPVPEIPVILLSADPRPHHERDHVMGLVMAKQRPRRAVWVFLSAVRWTLGQTPLGRPLAAREEPAVALALARVVAHEVVHAVAPERPHARAGLMSEALSRAFLLGASSPLDEPWARSFRSHLSEGLSLGGDSLPPRRQAVRDVQGPAALTPRDEPP